jgi:hypothetical protein
MNDISMQIFMMNQFLGRQNYAVNALMKLQFYGITEDQILSLCKTIETNGAQSINLKNRLLADFRYCESKQWRQNRTMMALFKLQILG